MRVLVEREVKRFFRQKGRVSGALITPLIIWIILGKGIGNSFRLEGSGEGYLEYFYPGVLLMVVLFTAIFSMITLIEDRDTGFLQGLWVSPISQFSMVWGKVMGCVVIALFQTFLFLFLAPLAGYPLAWANFTVIVLFLGLVAIEISALSFIIAWLSDSTQSFHVWMNLLLMPMWLFSGAVFDLGQVPMWMYIIMKVNPMTYALSGTRQLLYAQEWSTLWGSFFHSAWISLIFIGIFVGSAALIVSKKRS